MQDVQEFYLGHKVEVQDLSHDQDTTDLMKCIAHLEQYVLPPANVAVGSQTSATPRQEGLPADADGSSGVAGPSGGKLERHQVLVLGGSSMCSEAFLAEY